MRFGVRRLDAGEQNGRRYHLFDEDGRIKLVADYGSRWLPATLDHHVRFARATGDMVASMGLPRPASPGSSGRQHLSYAIILNHAVYAIINEYGDSTKAEGPLSTYFTIEVEGMEWLALKSEPNPYFSLYDKVSADLTIYEEPLELNLPESVGHIDRETNEYDFTVEMPAGRLTQTALVVLALIFLIDRPAEAGIRSEK